MTEIKKSFILCLASILIGIIVIVQCRSIPVVIENDIGAGSMPVFISYLIIFLSFIKMAMAFAHGKKNIETKEAVVTDKQEKNAVGKGMLTLVLLVAYVCLLDKIGFLLISIVYLFLQMLLFCPKDKRNFTMITSISVLTSIIIYVSFVYGLNLILPAGILKGII